MLEHLKWLLKRAGKLTAKVINEDKTTPGCAHVSAALQELDSRLQLDRVQAEQELQRINRISQKLKEDAKEQ